MLQLIALALAHLTIDMLVNVLPPILPLLIERFGLSLALAGTLAAVSSVSSGFTQPLFGHLIDQRGKGWLLPVCLLWVGAAVGLYGVASSYLLLLGVALVVGTGVACFHPLGMVMVPNTIQSRATAMSVWALGGTLGIASAPMLVVWLTQGYGLGSLPWLLIPAAFAALVLIWTRTHRVRVVGAPAAEHPEPAGRDIVVAAAAAAGRPERAFAQPEPAAGIAGGAVGSNWPYVIRLGGGLLLRSMAIMTLTTFIPIYYVRRGFGDDYGALMLTIFLAAGSAGAVGGGMVADRLGRKRVLIVTQLLAPFAIGGFLLAPAWLSITLLVLASVTLYASFSVGVVYGQELLPDNPGVASGLMAGFAWGTAAFVLAPIGAVGDAYGLPAAISLAAGACLVGALPLFGLPETLRRAALSS